MNDDDAGSTKFTGEISIDETKLNLENEKYDNLLAVENLSLGKKEDDSQVGESVSVSFLHCLTTFLLIFSSKFSLFFIGRF